MDRYDLAVIGSGPAGHFGSIQAAKLGKRVVAIEEHDVLGGTSALQGTIPSKSLREATLHLTGLRQRTFYGINYRVKRDLTLEDVTRTATHIVHQETAVFENQLHRNGIDTLHGRAQFVDAHTLRVSTGAGERLVEADKVLIAVGSRPAHPPDLDFDDRHIIDSNQILRIAALPRRLVVVGAGVIGIEYASIFSALGVQVTVINQGDGFLEFVDREIVERLKFELQERNVDFKFGEKVVSLEIRGERVFAITESNKEIWGDCVLYSIGRQGNTDRLALEAAGLDADRRGRLCVNENLQTEVGNIYAAGDVIGFPALAATSREQGRRAVCHAFGTSCHHSPAKLPYGIYSIPETSLVGATEHELTEQGVPYEVGRARYREIARGQILGDLNGMLKIVFHRETLRILGVHIIGEGATELIHIGQAAEAFGATLHYFVDAVFNYPTLAECYKVAALDGLNRLGSWNHFESGEDDQRLAA